jgi:hypothetical protein
MIRIDKLLLGALVAGGLAGTAFAGPEKVEFPQGYTGFTKLGQIDRYDSNTVRVFYANPAAMTAEPDKPIPSGAVLVLESRPAKLDGAGKPALNAEGRMVPDDKIGAVIVQEKRTGWAEEYPDTFRNPGWEYAVFEADGTRRASALTQPCMQCHKPRVADDYTFVFAQVIRDLKAKK